MGADDTTMQQIKPDEKEKPQDVQKEDSLQEKNDCTNTTDSESGEKALEIDIVDDQNEVSIESKDSSVISGHKRGSSSSADSSESKLKKARSKPKPQIIENMKEYVESNAMEKLTTATLRYWLREQSIHCTTRDKKADLVDKVCKHYLASTS